MPFYINDLANGIIIIMYALDDRRNKLKDKICVNVGAKGELTAKQELKGAE